MGLTPPPFWKKFTFRIFFLKASLSNKNHLNQHQPWCHHWWILIIHDSSWQFMSSNEKIIWFLDNSWQFIKFLKILNNSTIHENSWLCMTCHEGSWQFRATHGGSWPSMTILDNSSQFMTFNDNNYQRIFSPIFHVDFWVSEWHNL